MRYAVFYFLILFSTILTANESKELQAKLKTNLKIIGVQVATHFSDGESINIIHWSKMGVDKKLMKYVHPETKKEERVFIVKAGQYTGSAVRVLAATESPISNGYHYAVFEDGHVSTISKDKFQSLKSTLISITPINVKLSDNEKKEISQLITKLGDKKYKNRKAAKAELLKKGDKIVSHLKGLKKHDDFEVQLSINEIIKELSTPEVAEEEVPDRRRGRRFQIQQQIELQELEQFLIE